MSARSATKAAEVRAISEKWAIYTKAKLEALAAAVKTIKGAEWTEWEKAWIERHGRQKGKQICNSAAHFTQPQEKHHGPQSILAALH